MSGIAFAIAVFLAVTSALGVPLPVSGIYRPAPKGLASSLRRSQELPHNSGRRTCRLGEEREPTSHDAPFRKRHWI